MRLPPDLQRAIEEEAAQIALPQRKSAAQELSELYRRGDLRHAALSTGAHRAAYLQSRMPATYAACCKVFSEIRQRLAGEAGMQLRSLLDLGAGPGTAAWAARESFPGLREFTLVERDHEMAKIGRRMFCRGDHEELSQVGWVCSDATKSAAPQHDLVVISYLLAELPPGVAERLVLSAWRAASSLLVIIEPGTPRSFQTVLSARQALIDAGARILAPCPHHKACPMAAIPPGANRDDWCHFATRVERTAEHRRLKRGELGYEDEKYSYLVAGRNAQDGAVLRARIVRHPLFRPGHVKLTLCTADGLKQETIGRSEAQRYRQARKAEWGDVWE
ncbi:MAG: small ribosomal subunit Rsm22 family protein [Terriglobales bacterium]|jgi:ribosomal protein RSM22 (predicted rRNA methylase)